MVSTFFVKGNHWPDLVSAGSFVGLYLRWWPVLCSGTCLMSFPGKESLSESLARPRNESSDFPPSAFPRKLDLYDPSPPVSTASHHLRRGQNVGSYETRLMRNVKGGKVRKLEFLFPTEWDERRRNTSLILTITGGDWWGPHWRNGFTGGVWQRSWRGGTHLDGGHSTVHWNGEEDWGAKNVFRLPKCPYSQMSSDKKVLTQTGAQSCTIKIHKIRFTHTSDLLTWGEGG